MSSLPTTGDQTEARQFEDRTSAVTAMIELRADQGVPGQGHVDRLSSGGYLVGFTPEGGDPDTDAVWLR